MCSMVDLVMVLRPAVVRCKLCINVQVHVAYRAPKVGLLLAHYTSSSVVFTCLAPLGFHATLRGVVLAQSCLLRLRWRHDNLHEEVQEGGFFDGDLHVVTPSDVGVVEGDVEEVYETLHRSSQATVLVVGAHLLVHAVGAHLARVVCSNDGRAWEDTGLVHLLLALQGLARDRAQGALHGSQHTHHLPVLPLVAPDGGSCSVH